MACGNSFADHHHVSFVHHLDLQTSIQNEGYIDMPVRAPVVRWVPGSVGLRWVPGSGPVIRNLRRYDRSPGDGINGPNA